MPTAARSHGAQPPNRPRRVGKVRRGRPGSQETCLRPKSPQALVERGWLDARMSSHVSGVRRRLLLGHCVRARCSRRRTSVRNRQGRGHEQHARAHQLKSPLLPHPSSRTATSRTPVQEPALRAPCRAPLLETGAERGSAAWATRSKRSPVRVIDLNRARPPTTSGASGSTTSRRRRACAEQN